MSTCWVTVNEALAFSDKLLGKKYRKKEKENQCNLQLLVPVHISKLYFKLLSRRTVVLMSPIITNNCVNSVLLLQKLLLTLNKFHKYFTRIQIVSRVSHASSVFYFRKNLRLWCFTMFWIRLCLVFLLLTLTIYATASYSLLTCIFIIEKELLTGHNSHASFSKNIRSSSRVVLEL